MSRELIPTYKGDVASWARELALFLQNQQQVKRFGGPNPIQLPTQVTNSMPRATNDGVMMFDPTLKAPVYSVDGTWEPLYSGATPPQLGLGMHWDHGWTAGDYDAGSVVLDWPYLAIANTDTSDRPAPTNVGSPYWLYEGDPPQSSGGNRASVTVAIKITPTSAVAVERFRMYGVQGQHYVVSYIDPNGVAESLVAYTAGVTGWTYLQGTGRVLLANVEHTISVAITNPTGPQVVYYYDTDYYLANPNISGELRIHAGAFSHTQDAYGVDVELQNIAKSDDWDYMAISGGGGGSSGDFVLRTGDTMTGQLVLADDTTDQQIVLKGGADAWAGVYAPPASNITSIPLGLVSRAGTDTIEAGEDWMQVGTQTWDGVLYRVAATGEHRFNVGINTTVLDMNASWVSTRGNTGFAVNEAVSASQSLRVNATGVSRVDMYHTDLRGSGSVDHFVINKSGAGGGTNFYITDNGDLGNNVGYISANASLGATTTAAGGIRIGHGGSSAYVDNRHSGNIEFRFAGTSVGNISSSGTLTLNSAVAAGAQVATNGVTSVTPAAGVGGWYMHSGTTTGYRVTSTTTGQHLSLYSDVGAAATRVMSVLNSGNIVNVNNSYGALSDERLKNTIIPANPQLDDLRKLEVVNYHLNDDNLNRKYLGMISQQVQKIKPGLVEEDEDGFLMIKYSLLNLLNTKSIQELADSLDALSARITALETAL